MMNKRKLLYAASTASHLKRFHQPYLKALAEDFSVFTMANGEGVDFSVPFQKSVFSIKNIGAVRRIRGILKQGRFDGVILNTSLAAFLIRVALIGMKRRPKVLNIVHGYLFECPPKGLKDRLMLICEKITRRYTDGIAVMNAADLKIAEEHRLSLGATRFINGMGYVVGERSVERDEALRNRIAESDDYLMTFVGELSARKNQIFLIRCLDRLVKKGIPARLLLVGEGAEREALEREIAERGLSDRVILAGSQSSVLPYLSITDLYVSASRIEGLPFNLMEAMACGLPIVASDCKGQTDLLQETSASVYVSGDEDGFCCAVEQAYAKGERGAGSAEYPNLKAYALQSVLQENLNLMKGFFDYEPNED